MAKKPTPSKRKPTTKAVVMKSSSFTNTRRPRFLMPLIVAAVVIIGAGALLLIHADAPNTVDLADYGAIGDGTTDDTAAIQKAFTTVAPNTTIMADAGKTYRFTTALRLNVSGTHLTGGATFLATNQQSSAVYLSADNITVDGGLTLRTTNVTQRWGAPDQNGINIDQVKNATIKNITVDGSGAAGVFAFGATNYLIQDVTAENTKADAFHNTYGSSFGTIIRPTIRNAGDDGVAVVSYLADGKINHDISVQSPRYYGSTNGRAFSVVGGNNVTFNDVYSENPDAAAIYIGSEGDPYNTYPVSNVTFEGGTLVNSNQGNADQGAILILAGRSGASEDNILVENMTIKNTRGTTSRQIGLVNYGGSFSKITLRHLNFIGGGNIYGGNQTDGSVYNLTDWKKDGVALADHVGFSPQLAEATTATTATPAPAPVTTPAPVAAPTPAPAPQPAPASKKPDLVITSVASDQDVIKPGQKIHFKAVVKNQGTAATPAGTIDGVSFAIDGQQVSWSANNNDSLAPGASMTLTANGPTDDGTWLATSGNHVLRAYVDDVNRIDESNETNNIFDMAITVAQPEVVKQADLVVVGINQNPTSPQAGQSVRFSAVVKNVGNADTPDGTTTGVSFLIDGQQVSWSADSTNSIGAGKTVTLTANGPNDGGLWKATAGNHTVQAYVDDVNRISESNENNNTLQQQITVTTPASSVPAQPDLVVTAISTNPGQPTDGNHVSFTVTIKNVGSKATPDGSVLGVGFLVDNKPTNWVVAYQSLAPGSSIVLTSQHSDDDYGRDYWSAKKGNHTVQAYVDDVNRISESNETNNKLSIPFNVH